MVLNNLDLTSDGLFSDNRLFSISRFNNNAANHLLKDDISYFEYKKYSYISEYEYGVYCIRCGKKIKKYSSADSYLFSLLGEEGVEYEFHELCDDCDEEMLNKVVIGGRKVDENSFIDLLHFSQKKDSHLRQKSISEDFTSLTNNSLTSESDMWTDERREYVSFALKNGVYIW